VLRPILGLISSTVLLWLIACAGPPSVDDAHEAASAWPLAQINLPDEPFDLTAAGDEPGAAFGDEGDSDAGRMAPGLPDPTPYRPPIDMDVSGPMIPTPWVYTDFPDARFRRPERIRGLYANAWAGGSAGRMGELLDLAARTEINSIVIDIKDATGYLSHDTDIALAHEIGATEERRIADLPGLLDRLEAAGIYPIARIVVVKDPILAKFRPEFAVQDTAGGVWVDSKGLVWLNPFSEEMWTYNVEIAREVAEMGFPEIQWDYIRFPDAPESDMARAVFNGSEDKLRVDAIRGFLTYARDELSDLPVRSTADVFGVTTSFGRDIGIGQLWETFIDVVDAALPMVYPSHYWEGSFGIDDPNSYPYEVVLAALRDAQRRSAKIEGAGLTRPWLQDFSLGQPFYGGPEVRAQIQATYDAGVEEWVLWNPSSRYTESALEPSTGFAREPIVRVAGVLTPVTRRHVVIDSVAALPPAPEPTPDSVGVRVDSVTVVDTLGLGGDAR
jgi:hypothetical protein